MATHGSLQIRESKKTRLYIIISFDALKTYWYVFHLSLSASSPHRRRSRTIWDHIPRYGWNSVFASIVNFGFVWRCCFIVVDNHQHWGSMSPGIVKVLWLKLLLMFVACYFCLFFVLLNHEHWGNISPGTVRVPWLYRACWSFHGLILHSSLTDGLDDIKIIIITIITRSSSIPPWHNLFDIVIIFVILVELSSSMLSTTSTQ